jgi:predicted secreted protein
MIGKIAIGAAMLAMVAAVPARADDDKSGDKKEQMICKVDRATGSLIKTHKICMTADQWRDYYAKTKQQVDSYSDRQAQTNGGAGQAGGPG